MPFDTLVHFVRAHIFIVNLNYLFGCIRLMEGGWPVNKVAVRMERSMVAPYICLVLSFAVSQA